MTFDDTLELLGGTRKAKPGIKEMDHILGVSNVISRKKAKEQRFKAVAHSKQK